MNAKHTDVAIVGAGILGLAHAYGAAKSGRKVVVFERDPAAKGASIRNFGMVRPVGQPAGPLYEMALRSREIWIEVLKEAKLPFFLTGSLHAAYREDEAAVGQEFSDKAPAFGYKCAWLTAAEALERSQAIRPENLLGALWSPTELTVDPRQIVTSFPKLLAERYGVRFFFNTAVQNVETSFLIAGDERWDADSIIVAAGDDFQTLYPAYFRDSGITRCKLQMMRTVPQPEGWSLGPSLAFGPTFRHYPAFQVCTALPTLNERIAQETPEFDKYGIHLMVSQNHAGQLTIGDSHEYGLQIDVFDKPAINELMLNHARQYLRAPSFEIAEQWHGVYAIHPDHAYMTFAPDDGVLVVAVTRGIGMTMSFGIAEQTLREMSVAA